MNIIIFLKQIDDCLINGFKITNSIIFLNNDGVQARMGGEDIGYGFRRDLKLISEVQAPFRGVRRFFYVALSAAAGISLLFNIPRLIRAIQGGDEAPDVWETAGNLAVNVGGTSKFVMTSIAQLRDINMKVHVHYGEVAEILTFQSALNRYCCVCGIIFMGQQERRGTACTNIKK